MQELAAELVLLVLVRELLQFRIVEPLVVIDEAARELDPPEPVERVGGVAIGPRS